MVSKAVLERMLINVLQANQKVNLSLWMGFPLQLPPPPPRNAHGLPVAWSFSSFATSSVNSAVSSRSSSMCAVIFVIHGISRKPIPLFRARPIPLFGARCLSTCLGFVVSTKFHALSFGRAELSFALFQSELDFNSLEVVARPIESLN